MTNEIKALERKAVELEKQLFETRSLLQKAQCEALGIQIGDLVKDGREREFKVSRIDVWSFGKLTACLYGNKRTKAGEWSKTDQYIGTYWRKQ